MKVLPFESYRVGAGDSVRCPMCGWVHLFGLSFSTITQFCTAHHMTSNPRVETTTHGDTPFNHLHRTCRRCAFEWLEQTAPEPVAKLPARQPDTMG